MISRSILPLGLAFAAMSQSASAGHDRVYTYPLILSATGTCFGKDVHISVSARPSFKPNSATPTDRRVVSLAIDGKAIAENEIEKIERFFGPRYIQYVYPSRCGNEDREVFYFHTSVSSLIIGETKPELHSFVVRDGVVEFAPP